MRLRWKRSRGGRELRARLGLYVLFVSAGPGGSWRWSVVLDGIGSDSGASWSTDRGAERTCRGARRACERVASATAWIDAMLRRTGRVWRRRKARAAR